MPPTQQLAALRAAMLGFFGVALDAQIVNVELPDMEVGKTEVLTRTISRGLTELAVAHDAHRIEPADPYLQDYEETVARNVREQDADARPAIGKRSPRSRGTTWSCWAARSGTSDR